MSVFQYIKIHFFAKAFRIDLDEEFCYPNEKNFRFPNKLIIKTAIEKYGISNNQKINFLDENDNIVFMLNEKEKYRADLELGHQRFNQGYYVMCHQIF